MSDGSVFSSCIHALKYQQERSGIFRIKPVGEFINGSGVLLTHRYGFFLGRATGGAGIKILEADFASWFKGCFLEFHIFFWRLFRLL
jgi:hypothetical protein